MRFLGVAAVASTLLLGACDPIRMISASREVEGPLDQSCALEVLRASESVKAAGISDQGQIFADLVVPEYLTAPDPAPQIVVRETAVGSGETEVTFYVAWVGGEGGFAYQRYVEQVVDGLNATTVETCRRAEHDEPASPP